MEQLPTGVQLGPARAGDPRVFERLLSKVTCTVLQGGWYDFPTGWRLARRLPPYTIVFVCVGGEGRVVVGDQSYQMGPGTVIVSPPDVLQEAWNLGEEPIRMFTAHFTARLYGLLDMPSLYGLPVEQRPASDRFAEIVEAARRLVGELVRRAPGYGMAANGACLELIALLWRDRLAGGKTPTAAHGARLDQFARLEPVLRAIESRYAENLTLEQLAAVVHLHPAYFSTLFHRVTGLPPSQYLARYRLRQARDLLLATNQSIREIATATGFGDPFYLSRTFRRVVGVSPSEYRKSGVSAGLP